MKGAAPVKEINYYMKVPLPDGTFSNGLIDYNHVPKELGIHDLDLSGKRVLDIAANDGFWTFWAESRAAEICLPSDTNASRSKTWGGVGCRTNSNTRAGRGNGREAGAG